MSIRLDEKHGVNPSVQLCFLCNESMGVILFGELSPSKRQAFIKAGVGGGAEAPRELVLDREPCDKCQGYMEQGVILISVDEEKTDDMQNPYRSGGWCVVSDEFIDRVLDGPTAEEIAKNRMAFVPDDAWDKLSLPREAVSRETV